MKNGKIGKTNNQTKIKIGKNREIRKKLKNRKNNQKSKAKYLHIFHEQATFMAHVEASNEIKEITKSVRKIR